MEEGNAEIIPVDKDVLSAWLANNIEEYAEFKELCLALATETDITKISKTFDIDIESLINVLTVFMCLQEENVTINEIYTEAIAENNDFLYALCCYLYLDDGLELALQSIEIRKDVLRRFGGSPDKLSGQSSEHFTLFCDNVIVEKIKAIACHEGFPIRQSVR